MDQDKQTKADQDEKPPTRETNWKIGNTTPSIYPDVDMVNRTLP